MLARSKARREKRDAQLINAGLGSTMQRNPLQDYNPLQLLKVTTEGKICDVFNLWNGQYYPHKKSMWVVSWTGILFYI